MKHVGYYLNLLKKRRRKGNNLKQTQLWEAPAPNFLKINCDGAFRENTCSGGWGFVIRNDEGEALAAGAGHLQCLSDAFHERSNMHQSWAPHHSGDRCSEPEACND